MLRNAESKMLRHTFLKSVIMQHLYCCDFMQYPVPCNEEDKYDVILLHDVIEHVPQKAISCTPKKIY